MATTSAQRVRAHRARRRRREVQLTIDDYEDRSTVDRAGWLRRCGLHRPEAPGGRRRTLCQRPMRRPREVGWLRRNAVRGCSVTPVAAQRLRRNAPVTTLQSIVSLGRRSLRPSPACPAQSSRPRRPLDDEPAAAARPGSPAPRPRGITLFSSQAADLQRICRRTPSQGARSCPR